MMPSAQQVSIKQTMKPKIAFSIDSIVGNRLKNSPSENYCDDSNESKSPKITVDEYSQHLINCAKILSSAENLDYNQSIKTEKKIIIESSDQNQQNSSKNNINNNIDSIINKNSSDSDIKNVTIQKSRSPSPVRPPLIVPGIPGSLIRPISSNNAQMPPHHHYHEGNTHPHLLAQFQAAAALANVQAVQSSFPPHHLPPHLHNPNMPRESYPLYPWLLSRHGRIFPHRFPGNFLLQPFRKPKRVRTAFSPSQLLKLEHAFEGNHYVVGSERKTLAQQLSLTETQVKVWFQNRRTKFKRMQQEDSSDSKSGNKSSGSPRNFDDEDEDDDEMIDIGDECPTTDEEEMTVDNGA